MRFAAALSAALCGLALALAQAEDKYDREVNTPPARGERYPTRLKVGDAAPDFTLADPKGKNQVTLSSFKNKKPVVLIFGSYT